MSLVFMQSSPRHHWILPASWIVAVMWIGGSAAAADRPAPDPAAGQAAYEQSCARCHGVTGKGDGVDAKRFYPRPRDLSLGVYKFRSTASGTPPTDEDLFRAITDGLPGSNMPDWRHLDEATRWQLVAYLKSLSPVFEQTPPQPVTLAPDPGGKHNLAKGKELYAALGCAACHGVSGRANGTSAPTLVDDWSMPIRPADLTLGWNYRGGLAPRDIAMRLTAGIDGAGMPSYLEAISPEDAWQLAYYVASLQDAPQWRMIVHAAWINGELPSAPDDPRWSSAEQADVMVRNVVTPEGEWAKPPTVRVVSLQAVHNGGMIAWRLTWSDPTQEHEGAVVDGIGLVLKPEGSAGDIVTLQAWPYEGAPPLDICHWSADSGAGETISMDFEFIRGTARPEAPLASAATYEDGRWRLVLQRPLKPTVPATGAVLTPEQFAGVAVAVWDGGNPGARAVSSWVDVMLQRRKQ
jgi:cytochrome c oxidase cbb3-type subunit 2